jgi:hypothetical protein
MLVGDSVPMHLEATLESAAKPRGWRIVSAAFGGCSAMGERDALPDLSPNPASDDCPGTVVAAQQAMMNDVRPDVIVWWDRTGTESFYTDRGRAIGPESALWWRLRAQMIDAAVHRLTAEGAMVVFVAVEPSGLGVLPRLECSTCKGNAWVQYRTLHYDDVTRRWNAMLRTYARDHPDLAGYISITDRVCAEDVSPCDDTIDGRPARPDGVHYDGAGATLTARTILARIAPYVNR